MTQQKMFIQSWWVSPGGGKVGIITTPDQFKWYVYDTNLFQFMHAGAEINANVDADKKNAKGEPRPTILSLVGEELAVKSTAIAVETIPKEGKIIPQTEPQMAKTGYKADPAKTESIERQVSLKTAVELAVADKIKVEEIVSYAIVFNMYLSGDFSESQGEIIAKYIAKYGRKEVK